MNLAVGIAAAFAMGVELRRLVVLSVAVFVPYVFLVLMVLHVWRARPRIDARGALFCEAVASELRAGATLRDALLTSADAFGVGLGPEDSLAGMAAAIAEEFEEIGSELSLTVRSASRSGSDTASLFDEIGALALAHAEIAREVRTAIAPGRATALVLTAAPVLYVITQLGSGGLGRLLASSQQRLVTVLGFVLFSTGLALTLAIVWRSGR